MDDENCYTYKLYILTFKNVILLSVFILNRNRFELDAILMSYEENRSNIWHTPTQFFKNFIKA